MKSSEKVQKDTLELEREIKGLILYCALRLIPRHILELEIIKRIQRYEKKLPNDLIDKDAYGDNAWYSALEIIKIAYNPLVYNFVERKGFEKPLDYVKSKKADIPEYIKSAVAKINKSQFCIYNEGKKPISLWSKVELDLRYNSQMEMLDKCYKSGRDLFWLSSHSNCSKRCEKWQGKLVSLTLPSIDNTFWTGKTIHNNKIYSFTAIENQVDKYGYKNNIINGFNCRHFLIEYIEGKKPEFIDDKEIAKARHYESIQRELERAIRKKKSDLYITSQVDKKKSKKLGIEIAELEKEYKIFCKKHKLVMQSYRIM